MTHFTNYKVQFTKKRLGEVLTLQRGYDLPSRVRESGSIPIISSSGITGFHSIAKLSPPAIVTGRYGTIGEVFFIKESCWPLNTTLFVKDFHSNNPKYLSYLLTTLNIKELNSAGAVPGVNRNHLHKINVLIPPLPTQQKIAQVLSAYDDLIENNLKRIKLLEEMAQITYEQWFVRMKFPNHETNPIDAETGLPEGWSIITLGDACVVSGGGTPSKGVNEYWEQGNISWFTPTDLSKAKSLVLLDSMSKITKKGLSKSSAKLMQANSFLMSSRATIGLFGLVDKPFATNQGFINITPFQNEHKLFLLFNFKSRVQEFYNRCFSR